MKNKMKKKLKKLTIYILLTFLIYQICFNVILEFRLVKNNEDFIKCLLQDSNYYDLYEKKENNLLNKVLNSLFGVDDPLVILKNNFHLNADITPKMTLVSNQEKKEAEVYIYNTHQKEAYAGNGLKEYNITPGVLMASYLLQAKLAEQNITAQILENDITEYMNLNNMNYANSYKASRVFLENALKENPNYKLIIDLHRDSLPKDKSTVVIDKKNYAKISFVVGKEHKNANINLDTTTKLNNMIKAKYPTLTRGIIEKSGENVNGIYNQDLSGKVILIEIGGPENTIDEVLNTISVLAPIMEEYINGK